MLNSCVPRCSKILKVIVSHAQKINMFREMISVCVYSEWGEKVYCFRIRKVHVSLLRQFRVCPRFGTHAATTSNWEMLFLRKNQKRKLGKTWETIDN